MLVGSKAQMIKRAEVVKDMAFFKRSCASECHSFSMSEVVCDEEPHLNVLPKGSMSS